MKPIPGSRISIRPAQKSDLPELLKLERASFSTHAISDRQMAYLQKNPAAIFLVAMAGPELAGDAIALVRRHQGRRLSGRIYTLIVNPKFRGRTIGRKLMTALMHALEEKGVGRTYLEVQATNRGAIALYEKLGFHVINSLKDYYGRGKHGVHMVAGE